MGSLPDAPIRFRERGLTMEADVVRGQKTGHFLDQRDNRALVRSMSEGRDVLDVFASTGGFALSAAAGGARSVHLVDLAAPAIETARRNLGHNSGLRSVRECTVRTTVGDAFQVMAQMARSDGGHRSVRRRGRRPALVRPEPGVGRAGAAGLRQLTRLAIALVRPGGMLVQCSCSSRVDADTFASTVHDAARRTGRPLHEVRRTGHAVDHPIGFSQGAYLKAVYRASP